MIRGVRRTGRDQELLNRQTDSLWNLRDSQCQAGDDAGDQNGEIRLDERGKFFVCLREATNVPLRLFIPTC
jgi:hypothetical protein